MEKPAPVRTPAWGISAWGVRPLELHSTRCNPVVQVLQALHADMNAPLFTCNADRLLLNIRLELPLRVPHRVADVMPKLRPFTTNFTFSHMIVSPPLHGG